MEKIKIIHMNNIIFLDEGAKFALNWLEESIEKGFFEEINSIKELPSDFKYDFSKFVACLDYGVIGKKILDLGCGSTEDTIEFKAYPKKYEPWLCRALWSMRNESLSICHYHPEETQIIGVDIGDLSKEKFPHKKLNLLEENVLVNNFEKDYFDLINASMLFNSPELEKRVTGQESDKDACEKTSKKLKEILLPQIISRSRKRTFLK
jgi:SAM-dependent methyltransferase